jgi:hypothetical protein
MRSVGAGELRARDKAFELAMSHDVPIPMVISVEFVRRFEVEKMPHLHRRQ